MCPILPDPLNGQIVYSTNTTGEQVFGATSTYVCDSGFGLSGGERVRACSSDSSSTIGFWTGSAPSCLGETLYTSLKIHPTVFVVSTLSLLVLKTNKNLVSEAT